jgi:hypothetical protein
MAETPAAPAGPFETCSWAGTDAKGVAHTGRTGLTLAQIAQVTENYYRKGWQSLRVFRGWDVPDADTPDLVAMIGPHPETGKRMWWAEGAQAVPEEAERAIRAQLGETDAD